MAFFDFLTRKKMETVRLNDEQFNQLLTLLNQDNLKSAVEEIKNEVQESRLAILEPLIMKTAEAKAEVRYDLEVWEERQMMDNQAAKEQILTKISDLEGKIESLKIVVSSGKVSRSVNEGKGLTIERHNTEAGLDETIIEHLKTGQVRFSELVASVSVSKPTLAEHLKKLVEARKIENYRDGNKSYYRLVNREDSETIA